MKLFRSTASETPSVPHDPSAPQGFVIFEIDDFEPLESLFGDLLALEVVEQIERRLMPRLPHGCTLWRPERGRFALSVPESSEQKVTTLANDLKAVVARSPISSSAGGVMITLSAGCSVAGPSEIHLLGPAAKRALDLARAAGRARTRLLPADCADNTAEEITLRAVRAIEAERILLHYQPVMRIGPGERIAFHEALARLPNEGGQAIAAREFVDRVEHQGQVHRLDRLVLQQTFDVLVAHPNIRLSVNISAAAILDPEWIAIWDRRRLGQPELGERLIVELTGETLLKDPIASGAFIERLRAGGSSLLLDGFDPGVLTYEHLKSLRFDIVKLQPALLAGLGPEDEGPRQLTELQAEAERLDLMVVATHVETPAQVRWLMKNGISYAQGRYYGMPDANPYLGSNSPSAGTVTSSGSVSQAASASR